MVKSRNIYASYDNRYFTSREDLNIAFKDTELIKQNFSTIVDKISVEIIDENEDSIIEMEIDLRDE
ncbi:hypothetical protein ACQPUL_19285 [Clostridium butyricum]